MRRGVDLYVALMDWAADIDGRPARPQHRPPPTAHRPAELCMLMVGHAFHDLHTSPPGPADEQQLEDDLLLLVSRALRLD